MCWKGRLILLGAVVMHDGQLKLKKIRARATSDTHLPKRKVLAGVKPGPDVILRPMLPCCLDG
jgi:hypothetical protein